MSLPSYMTPYTPPTLIDDAVNATATTIVVCERGGIVAGMTLSLDFGYANYEQVTVGGGYVAGATGRGPVVISATTKPHVRGAEVSW